MCSSGRVWAGDDDDSLTAIVGIMDIVSLLQ